MSKKKKSSSQTETVVCGNKQKIRVALEIASKLKCTTQSLCQRVCLSREESWAVLIEHLVTVEFFEELSDWWFWGCMNKMDLTPRS